MNGWCGTLQGVVHVLLKISISTVSQVGRQCKSGNQGREDRIASLSLTLVPHTPLGDSVGPIPAALGSARLVILVGRLEYSFYRSVFIEL